jgi:hypothetical protein
MTTLKEVLTTKILSIEILDQNEKALDMISNYSKVYDIIERTYIAMGKKSTFRIESSSTKNQKLNTNAYASTH